MRIPRFLRRRVVWGPIVALALVAIVVSFFRGADDRDSVPFSEVLTLAGEGRVERIEVRGGRLEISMRGEEDEVRSRMGSGTDLTAALADAGANIAGGDGSIQVEYKRAQAGPWIPLIFNLALPALFLVILYYAVRNAVREGIRRSRAESTND